MLINHLKEFIPSEWDVTKDKQSCFLKEKNGKIKYFNSKFKLFPKEIRYSQQ